MNKSKAKAAAVNNTKTWGELLMMIRGVAPSNAVSSINSGMSREKSLKVMSEAVSTFNSDLVPNSIRCEKGTLSIDGVIVMNIYRECES